MRHLLASLFMVGVMALPAAGQTVCAQLGAFTDCSGSNGRSATIVDLGNNQGVILTDQSTDPYTILRPAQGSPALPALPTLQSLPTLEPPSQTGGVDSLMLSPGMGEMGTMIMLGQ